MKAQSTAREMISFSLPLIFSGILQQLYSWADAFIVGRVEGELALAAVGATSSISYFLVNTILGFTLGLSVMAGQHFGRRDNDTVRRMLHGWLPLLTGAYTALSVLAMIFAQPVLRLMATPEDIFTPAQSYLTIIFAGIPFLACYNLFAALLRAIGNTKAAFYAVLVSSGLNVVLDVLFVAVFGWGVAGAAWATVISQAAMTVYIILYTFARYPWLRRNRDEKRFGRTVLSQGLRFSVPPTVQNSVTSLGNLVLQNFMNSFGSITVLAITTAYRVDSMMLLPIFNLGAAISSMTARARGADDRGRIQSTLTTGLVMMTVVCVVLSVVMFVFGAQFVAIFGVGSGALSIGSQFFRDLSIFYTLFGIGIVLRSVLEGLGDMTWSSAIGIGMLAVRILFSYLLRPVFAERTIAIAEGFAWILMLLVLVARCAAVHRQLQKRFSNSRNVV